MRKYFEISGYWKDNNEEFEGYIVTNYDDHEEGGRYNEYDIFYFGLEESDIQAMIEDGEDTIEDFVITGYKQFKFERPKSSNIMTNYKLYIDWQQLRDDKELLISMNITHPHNFDGLIHLIDCIQDQAVDVHGLSVEEVFNFEREVDIDEDMEGEWIRVNPIYDPEWLDASDREADKNN